MKKNDLKVQKEETEKDTADRTVAESGVMVCRHCSKSENARRAHEIIPSEAVPLFKDFFDVF